MVALSTSVSAVVSGGKKLVLLQLATIDLKALSITLRSPPAIVCPRSGVSSCISYIDHQSTIGHCMLLSPATDHLLSLRQRQTDDEVISRLSSIIHPTPSLLLQKGLLKGCGVFHEPDTSRSGDVSRRSPPSRTIHAELLPPSVSISSICA